MANILFLTNIYTHPEIPLYGSTKVCEYFIHEWKGHGHNIKVVYNYIIYPKLFHLIAKKYSTFLGNYFPTVINSEYYNESFEYEYDDIKVLLNPIFKLFPKYKFSNPSLSNASNKILDWLNKWNFKPDIIIGHFLHPNIELLPILSQSLNCKCAIILHGKFNKKRDDKLLNSNYKQIDFWGFRSYPIKESFSNYTDRISKEAQFMCFSGIPENYINDHSWRKHNDNPPTKILFVGNLISRKFPLAVLEAFHHSFHSNDSKLTFIGSGMQTKCLNKYIQKNKIEEHIIFKGRQSREDVHNEMITNDIFALISKDETFGLVYLEAMACGCIVIASREEGMDGIIDDGNNGFLCEAGNANELEMIFTKIQNMNAFERQIISRNAIETAKLMTDKKMSILYLNNLLAKPR